MANFIDLLKNEQNRRSIETENGALMYGTSGSALLDMHFKVSSYRDRSEEEIVNDFIKAYAENPEIALKWMFYVGDIREGLGERRLFRILIKNVLPMHKNLIEFIGEYNRFDSLLELFGTDAEKEMLAFVSKQLKSDIKASLENKPCSLLAKWMPSINTSSVTARLYAKKFCKAFGKTEKEYRKMLTEMRAYIDVIEQKMCAGEWNKIEYSKVPSKANLLYKNAFMKHDYERRNAYLDALSKGKTKINASVAFPHDIIHKYHQGFVDTTYEEMWKALPNKVDPSKPVLVIRDGSYSMTTKIGNTEISALEVATALTIYFSEHTNEAFKDKFITFSSDSEVIDLSNCKTFLDKVKTCYAYDDCSNTNIEKVFDEVLKIAVDNNLKQEDIPTLLIVSDMEFDAVANGTMWAGKPKEGTWNSIFEIFAERFAEHGFKLPKLVFWNVCSRTNGIPLQTNELGVTLVSGFSVNACNMILTNELDPYKALLAELNKERYAKIKEA